MQRSAAKLALAAGAVLVLALAIGLVRLMPGATEPAEPAAPTRSSPAPANVPAPVPVPVAARAPAPPLAARDLPSASATRHAAVAPRAQPPELPAPPISLQRELKRDANGHLVPIIPLGQLQAQSGRTDAPMKACIARSRQRPTGKATLSFTVVPRNGKLIIETTGVEDADTLADYADLLECMHRTANALVLDDKPIPELGTPIYVRRRVRIENGELAENTFFNFSYNP